MSEQLVCNWCAREGNYATGKPLIWFQAFKEYYCPEHFEAAESILRDRVELFSKHFDAWGKPKKKQRKEPEEPKRKLLRRPYKGNL